MTVKLFKLVTGQDMLGEEVGLDPVGDLIVGHPAFIIMVGGDKGNKVRIGFHEVLPLKKGDNVTFTKSAVIATAPISEDHEVYRMYAQTFLGQQIITAPKEPILLVH